jgi:4,5-DOPA dioxygenase extradiol
MDTGRTTATVEGRGTKTRGRMPTLFIAHGWPLLLDDARRVAQPRAWARELDDCTAQGLAGRQVEALLDYRRRAPAVERALPTHEHFVPVVTATGAALGDAASFPITGFLMGSLTKRSVEFG